MYIACILGAVWCSVNILIIIHSANNNVFYTCQCHTLYAENNNWFLTTSMPPIWLSIIIIIIIIMLVSATIIINYNIHNIHIIC